VPKLIEVIPGAAAQTGKLVVGEIVNMSFGFPTPNFVIVLLAPPTSNSPAAIVVKPVPPFVAGKAPVSVTVPKLMAETDIACHTGNPVVDEMVSTSFAVPAVSEVNVLPVETTNSAPAVTEVRPVPPFVAGRDPVSVALPKLIDDTDPAGAQIGNPVDWEIVRISLADPGPNVVNVFPVEPTSNAPEAILLKPVPPLPAGRAPVSVAVPKLMDGITTGAQTGRPVVAEIVSTLFDVPAASVESVLPAAPTSRSPAATADKPVPPFATGSVPVICVVRSIVSSHRRTPLASLTKNEVFGSSAGNV
jgi:hypothetical protein